MTLLAHRITDTPMAPYMGLLRSMTDEEKRIVVTFLIGTMENPVTSDNRELIKDKYKNLRLSSKTRQLRGSIKLTAEDMSDERTQYILSK